MKRRFLLAAVSTGLFTAGRPAVAEKTGRRRPPLRVMTYNIHAGVGSDGRFDLQRVAEVVHAARADVVGLQEVDVHWSSRSEWCDVASRLARMLGMAAFFAPIYDLDPPWPGAPRRRYGLAVLSRYPVLRADNHRITRLPTGQPDPVAAPVPGFPEVVIDTGGPPVHFYATHLDHRPDPAVRREQVAEMLDLLGEDPARAAQVLVGDFNAPPGAPELDPLLRTLTDAWTVAGGPGAGLTHPAENPAGRLDYVLACPRVRIISAEVPAVTASDHRPVVADIEV